MPNVRSIPTVGGGWDYENTVGRWEYGNNAGSSSTWRPFYFPPLLYQAIPVLDAPVDQQVKNEKIIQVQWERPDEGWIKINSDASVRKNSAAVGGLGRDKNGDILFILSEKIEPKSVVEAESIAMLMCLSHAIQLGYQKIWMELDSNIVADAIINWPSKSGYTNKAIEEIGNVICIIEWKCSHIFREGNAAADYLAKLGHDGGIGTLEDKVPTELITITRNDAFGAPYERRRPLT